MMDQADWSPDASPSRLEALLASTAASAGLVDQTVAGVVRLVEASEAHRIACRRGCNACCTTFVAVTYAEAASIAAWLRAPGRAERLARFHRQVAAWHALVGEEVRRLEALCNRRDVVRGPDTALPEMAASVIAYRQRRLSCPFNDDDGSCEVYGVRPIACRAYLVADTSGGCPIEEGRGVPVVTHPGLSTVVRAAMRDLRGASSAEGCEGVIALPAAVERALAGFGGDPDKWAGRKRTRPDPGENDGPPARGYRCLEQTPEVKEERWATGTTNRLS